MNTDPSVLELGEKIVQPPIPLIEVSLAGGQLAKALAIAQGEFKDIKKTKTVDAGSYKYNYAPLDQIRSATQKALSANGLAIMQVIKHNGGKAFLVTKLVHTSGENETSSLEINTKLQPQQLGSQLTYFRRYELSAILGVAADEDDDGRDAQNASTPPQGQQNRAPRVTPRSNNKPAAKPPKANPKGIITQARLTRLCAIITKAEGWTMKMVDDIVTHIFKLDSKKKLNNTQYSWIEKQVTTSTFDKVFEQWTEKQKAAEPKEGDFVDAPAR